MNSRLDANFLASVDVVVDEVAVNGEGIILSRCLLVNVYYNYSISLFIISLERQLNVCSNQFQEVGSCGD